MGTPETIMNDAVSYIQIIFLFMSVSYAYNFLSGILRAVGDSKNPVIAMVIACIINVVLDVVLVMYVHLGVAGAAYATVIAQAYRSSALAMMELSAAGLRFCFLANPQYTSTQRAVSKYIP